MTKKKILLIFGSKDSEHEISIKSAESIFQFFPVDEFDCVPVYIQRSGLWISGDFNITSFEKQEFVGEEVVVRFDASNPSIYFMDSQRTLSIDGAFLALHGPIGEGGHIQGLLDMASIPYSGSDLLASVTCMDKALTHQICESHGISMAPYQLITSVGDINFDLIQYPVIVKPAREGSSFGVSSAHDQEGLLKGCELAFKYDQRILIEQLIKGSEASIAVLDTKNHKIVSNPVQTILESDFFSYEEKYITDASEVHYQALYTQETIDKLKAYSRDIFKIMGARHLSRLDFFVTEDESIYFNEINTMPGFTNLSFYPTLIANEGLPYTELIRSILRDVVA